MAEDTYKEDKTEPATGKKRGNLRNKGNVVMSQEINSVAVILFSVLILYGFGGYLLTHLLQFYTNSFSLMSWFRVDQSNLRKLTVDYLSLMGITIGPIMFFIMVSGFLAAFSQIGWLWTTEPLMPKLSKLKPKFSELNIFKKEKIVMLLLQACKLGILLPVAYSTIKKELPLFINYVDKPVFYTWVFIMKLAYKVIMRLCIFLIFIAAADYAWKWWKHEEDIKMTKEEVKQERKDIEGDPKIKSWQRRERFKLFRQFMMKNVPEADVVITNPVTYAVAVKYDDTSMNAPQVVAKGMRKIAERIKEIAKEHNVPIVENKPLAQALYYDVEIGQEIPSSFYKAIAEVLAYVYKLKNKRFVSSKIH